MAFVVAVFVFDKRCVNIKFNRKAVVNKIIKISLLVIKQK